MNKEMEKKEYDFHANTLWGDIAWALVFAVVYFLTIGIILCLARLISLDFYKYLQKLSPIRKMPNILVWFPGAITGLYAAFFAMSHAAKPIHIDIDGNDVSVTQGNKVTAFRLSEIKKVKYLKSDKKNLIYRVLQIKASKKKIYIAVRNLCGFHSSQDDIQQIEEFYQFIERNKGYNE